MSKDMVAVADLARVLLTYNLLVGVLLIVASEKLGVMASGVLSMKKPRVARLTSLSCATVGACLVVLSLIVLTLTFIKP